MSLLNLSLSNRDKALWSTLVGAGFGYLVPNSRFKHVGGGGGNDESIHYLVAQQQLDGPLPGQQGVAMKDETERICQTARQVGSGTIGGVVSG